MKTYDRQFFNVSFDTFQGVGEKRSKSYQKACRKCSSRPRPPRSPPPPRFPGVQFNSLPTDRCALLSERLEQANESSLNVHITLCIHRLFACNIRPFEIL